MFEQQNHHETQWAAIRSIAEKSGMSAETVRKWVRQAERDEGRRPGLSTDERDRLSKLEKENKELKRANKDLEGCFGFLRGGARPPTDQMIDFIDHNRARWGVEPICRVLPIASSTYYAAKKRPTAMRTLRDEDLKVEIWRVWDENFRVYGARKIWIALNREGIRVARCTVAPLDAPARHQGRCRRKAYRTTWPHEEATERSRDLVERAFNASAPNRLWVADVTYARTLSGVAYVCLIIDCFARMIVGWHLSRSLKTELCLDALEHAIWARGERNLGGLIHHSDRGVQFLSIRYTERVAEIGAVTSVGSRGDSFDNALAESVIGLYKTEYARNGGVPRGFDDLELRTLEWIDWWNHRRLLEPIGDVPPAEAEAVFYSQGAPVTGTGTQGTEFLWNPGRFTLRAWRENEVTMSTLAPVFAALPAKPDHDALERSILELWERDQTFRRLREMNDGGPRFSFIDGPVTANKNLGVHTAWGRTLKDVFQRYKALRGYHQRYQNGFDCQGLWIEVGVERELGLNSKREIEEYGLAQFAKKCRDVVVRSSTALTEGSIRLGQWMDWGRDYFTFSDTNIEHIWRFLQLMHERGWLYRGHRATEWCPRCGTSISGHELAGSYANRLDPSVQVRLPLKERPDEALRVWTTTPWTLPANVAAAVRPDATYGRLQDGDWVAVDLFPNETFREVRLGRELVGWQYEGPFDTLSPSADTEHRVIPWEDVSLDEGTGIVHLAPGCGVEDFELAKAEALPLLMPVDESGRFLHEYGWLAGLSTNEALEPILKDLQRRNRLAQVSTIDHRYPECWRCHTPLIYRVSDDWFIAVDGLREQLRAVNERIKWIPEYMGKRMDDWLLNMKDWNISRRRYYGLPLPFYPCACGQLTVIGSRSELKTRATRSLDHLEELHRPWIDAVRIHCDGCGGEIQRVPEVGDVWLDAGIVPFSTLGWQNPESVPQGFATGAARGLTTADLPDHSHWEKWFPADWVCEMREQIRLWFYSQLFISVALTGKAPFRTVLGYEKMLDEHGREMHGSWGNMISADDAFARLGADVMRWQYCMQPPNKNLLFGFDRGSEIQRKFLTLWNSASFLIQYANLASFRPVCEDASREAVDESLAPLDRWLVARARQLVSQASEAYENYSTLDVIRASERFIDDMSNWYIRRSRRRFWDGDHVALQTLWYGLVQLIRTIAPITPFIAEHLWQTLVRNACREAPISVFLAGWPNILSPDQHLLEDIAEVRRVVELGRKARMRSRLRTRQPLPRIVVEGPARISRYAEEIADELRVKQTEFGSIRASKLVVRPNLRRLGPRLGSQVRRVQAALDAGDFEQLAEGRYRAAGVELEASDVVEEWVTVEGWVVESAGNITVALDATLDDELRREGRVYDLIHLVNAMRREARLAITDRIALTLPERDADLLLHREWIMAETLARSLQVDAVEEPTIVEVSSESVKDEAVDGMRNCGAPRR